MARFAVAILLLTGVFGGYRLYRHVAAPLMSAQTVANQVGAAYGDPHPQIVRVLSTESDGAVHNPMYILTVRGHFHEGSRTARYLEFSALANRRYAWALWAGNTLPGQGARRLWFADMVPLPAQL